MTRSRRRPSKPVHIQDEQFTLRSLCGHDWNRVRGGRVASDTEPPVVTDDAGSVNAVTCRTCLAVWRRLASFNRMSGAYVEPKITRYSLDDMEYALRVGLTVVLDKRPTDECIAVAMAKCRGETANGNSVWNNNLGNIKPGKSWTGNFTCILLNEVELKKERGDTKPRVYWYDPRGELVGGKGSALRDPPLEVPDGHVQTRMRSFAGPTDAGYQYIDFIFANPRYARARDAMLAGNPEAYAHELKVAGYYTAPEADYVKLVMALYRPSLAVVQKKHAEQPVVIEKNEWHNQLLLDQFVETEYERVRNDPGFGGARAAREYELAEEAEKDAATKGEPEA